MATKSKNPDFNTLIIKGYVIDVPIKSTASNGNELYKFKFGSRINENKVNYLSVEVWDKKLFNGISFFNKGTKLILQGTLIVDTYIRDEIRKTNVKIIIDKFSFVGVEKTVEDENGNVTDVDIKTYNHTLHENNPLVREGDAIKNEEAVEETKEDEDKAINVNSKFEGVDIDDDDLPF